MFTEIKVNTTKSECLVNITEQVQQAIAESKVQEGICVVFVPHTTAAITINSCLDSIPRKILSAMCIVWCQTRVDFKHIYDTPADAAGHIKSVLIGNSLSLIIKDGKALLGDRKVSCSLSSMVRAAALCNCAFSANQNKRSNYAAENHHRYGSGVDDSIAISVALRSPELEVVGLTSVLEMQPTRLPHKMRCGWWNWRSWQYSRGTRMRCAAGGGAGEHRFRSPRQRWLGKHPSSAPKGKPITNRLPNLLSILCAPIRAK
jgi:secondary thiamine-phosphate synthase enzyme